MLSDPGTPIDLHTRRLWAIAIGSFAICSMGCFYSPWYSVDPVIENRTNAAIHVRLTVGDRHTVESMIPPGGSLSLRTPPDRDLDRDDPVRVEATIAGSAFAKPAVATSDVYQDGFTGHAASRHEAMQYSFEHEPHYVIRHGDAGLVIDRRQRMRDHMPISTPSVEAPSKGGTP